MDYKDKIQKLLNLAKSPNESEARSALLMARKLMAKHKIEVSKEPVAKEVKHVLAGVTCSKARDPWIMELSSVIGENYCCKSYLRREQGKRTYETAFVGFEEDVKLCVEIFKYAVNCVRSMEKKIKKQMAPFGNAQIKASCNGYGYGFAAGMKDAFKKQTEEQEKGWGLVLTVPKEVTEAADAVATGKVTTKKLI